MVRAKSATTIRVRRVRFFSMMVVPGMVPPTPPPREDERPPPLPECNRISPMSAMQKMAWKKASTYTMRLLYHRSLLGGDGLLSGLDELHEALDLEARPADERAVNVFLGHDLRCVIRLDGAAVEDTDPIGEAFVLELL